MVFPIEDKFDSNTVEGHIGYKNKEPDSVYIIFEGSDSEKDGGKDWNGPLGNFNFFPKTIERTQPITLKVETKILVHSGHYNAFKKIKPFIHSIVNRKDVKKIYVAGHSRGGPIAAYTAENLGFHYGDKKKIYYIGAAPSKAGNKFFWTSLIDRTGDHIELWVGDDPVPGLPPFGTLCHAPKAFELKRSGILPILFGWVRFINPIGWPGDHYPDIILKEATKQL